MPLPIQVCVVNYNTREHLHACLAGLNKQTPGRVIVVDNASVDGSAEMVRREFPDVKLIANDKNLGFGAAANQAIEACELPYMLLLNSDTRVQPGSLHALADYLRRSPQAAIVGPRLLNSDGTLQRSCRRFPGSLLWLLDNRLGGKLGRCLGVSPKVMLHTWDHDSSRPVPWVIGAALALRVQPVRQVGGFDAGYFLYCEEIDLCMRLWGAGWEVHFTPTANVTHVGGSSTTGDRSSTDQHMVTSTLRFYRIHYGSLRGWFLRMLLHAKLVLTGKRAVRTLIGRPPGCAPHPWTRQ